MRGTDFEAIFAVKQATPRRVTAAGGIPTQREIDALDEAAADSAARMAIYTEALLVAELSEP